jgi:hypothetical protein
MDIIVESTNIARLTGVPQDKEDIFTTAVQESIMKKVSTSQNNLRQ